MAVQKKNYQKSKKAHQLAKLMAPALPRVIERPRLFRLLDRAGKHPVTWIVGPPGAGKTTLVASYLKARKRRALWYRLDEGDADLSSFFYYLAQTAHNLSPRRKDRLPALTPDYFLGLTTFVQRFFERLCERLPQKCAIVFDNYQDVPPAASLHEFLPLALGEIPPQVSVIVISRELPPASCARLQAEQRLVTIAAEHFTLTDRETRALISLHVPRFVPGAQRDATRLVRVAQGWVAGVILVLEQIDNNPSARNIDPQTSLTAIFRYLAAEAFGRAAPDRQVFLLRTSVLPEMTAKIAASLTGFPWAEEYLTSLYQARYFTEQVEHTGHAERWYRYHPLFRDCLLEFAAKHYSLEELRVLRQKGAQLFIEAGHAEQGVGLLRAARDWDAVGQQAMVLAPLLVQQGRLRTFEVWVEEVATKSAGDNPWVSYWLAICRVAYDPAQSIRLLEGALAHFKKNNDTIGWLAAWSVLVGSAIVQLADLSDLDRWIDELPYALPKDLPPLPPELELQVIDAVATALVWRQPGLVRTDRWVEKVAELKTRFTIEGQVLPLFCVETYYLWMGDIPAARAALETLKNGLARRREPASAGVCAYAESTIAWYEADTERCRATIAAAIAISQREGTYAWLHLSCAQGVYNELFAGNLAQAEWFLERCRPPDFIKRGVVVAHHRFLAGWCKLQANDFQGACAEGDPDSCSTRAVAGPFSEALYCIQAGYVRLGLGEIDTAERFATRGAETAAWMNSDYLQHGANFLEALIAFARGDETSGYGALRNALQIGRRRDLMGCAGWHAPSVAHLCAKALEAGIEVDYVKTLLKKRWLPLPEDAYHIDAWPWPVKIYTLGEFRILIDDEPLVKKRKAPHRLMDFLKTVIAFGGSNVPATKLMDTLWPESDGAAAKENLDKTLQRLRHLSGHENMLPVRQARISLNPELCWVDAWAFEKLLDSKPDDRSSLRKAISLYKGSFLSDDEEVLWTHSMRHRLHSRYSQATVTLGE